MANTIKHKRSSTPGSAPSSGDLADGELALNTADGSIYMKNSAGNVIKVGQSIASFNGDLIPSANNTYDLGASGTAWAEVHATTFTGALTGNVTGDVTGNADTATALETARTIGGVSFDGTANINLPGVDTTGNQDTSGNAATATKLATARAIALSGDVSGTANFDGSAGITITATIADDSHNHTISNVDGLQTALDAKLALAGGTMTGAIAMSTNKITGLGDPTTAQDAATKAYVDAATSSGAIDLGADTSGNYVATIAGTTNEITVSGSGSETAAVTIGLPDDVTITNDLTVGNDLTVTGNLTVSGTTTTVNTETINLADNIILINSNEAGTPSQNGGIEIERGTSTNVTLVWDETADKWTVGSQTFVASTFEGALTGNASTASKWATARTITLGGDLTGNVSIDGSANVTLTAAVVDDSHNHVTGNIDGLAEYISDTVGAMVTSNTESGISVTYDDADNTLDFDVADFTITLTGDVTGSGTVTNLGNVSFATTIAANSVALGTDTTGNYVAAGATSGNGISGSVSSEGGTFTVTSNATSANTASTIVFRDGSGNFSAGTITAALTGNVTGNVTGSSGSCTGNAATATTATNVTATANNSTNETTYITFVDGATGAQGIETDTGLTYNPSTGNLTSTLFTGTATSARYADLAEKYAADGDIEPGTVVCFGGDAEVQVCDHDMDRKVAGVVSTDPAYMMNSEAEGVYVALTGRVPCKVVGPVRKGDMMVSAGNGQARAEENPVLGSVIGKALENFDGEEGVIEVVVGRL